MNVQTKDLVLLKEAKEQVALSPIGLMGHEPKVEVANHWNAHTGHVVGIPKLIETVTIIH